MKILIIHPYDQEEIEFPSFGGTRLISDQRKVLEKLGYWVESLSIHKLPGFVSLFLKLLSKLRRTKGRGEANIQKSRWLLSLLYILFIHFLSKIDLFYSRLLKKYLRNKLHDAIICNYPLLAEDISKIAHQFNVPVFLYEHNIEWGFFNKVLNKDHFAGLLIQILKIIELRAAEKVDHVICVADEDREMLVHGGIPSSKVDVWVPFSLEEVGAKFSKEKKDRFRVGFIGSNFGPNVSTVRTILKIAHKMLKINPDAHFLVVGSVKEAFRGYKDIPENVKFTGFVKDLDPYLELCDVFINPKIMSDAGIEIKMLGYLKSGKPVITTNIGVRGYPLKHLESCIIENDVNRYDYWIAKLIEDAELRNRLINNISNFATSFIKNSQDVVSRLFRKCVQDRTQNPGGSYERIDPLRDKKFGSLIKYEHMRRYELAAEKIDEYRIMGKVNLLDLGCGFGYGSNILPENVYYIGGDISFEALKYANINYPNAYVVLDCHRLPFKDHCFDFIVLFEVIEHIERPRRIINDIYRCLKENGLVLISTPNREYLPRKVSKILLKLLGRTSFKGSSTHHVREFSFREFENLLKSQKEFELIRITGGNILPPKIGDFILHVTPKKSHKYIISLGRIFPSYSRDFIAILKKG